MSLAAPAAVLAVFALALGSAAAGLTLAPGGLWRRGAADLLGDPYLRRVVLFTLAQAGLSTLLAVGLAIPVARALSRQDRFIGRDWLLRLFALPPVLPALTAVLGIVAVFGGNGWLNRALEASGAEFHLPLYGLAGILIAHVFFNLPLATRLLLFAWQSVPAETWRLAAQLGMGSRAIWRTIEAPLLRRHAPGIAGFVFLLCMLSFSTVLTLGGGPAATTIEVAIYQALRFDFAPERAALLALFQLILCLGVLLAWQRLAAPMPPGTSLGRSIRRPDRATRWSRGVDALVLFAAGLFVLAPLLAVVVAGASVHLPSVLGDAAIWRALGLSLAIAALASLLAALLAAGLLIGARALRRRRATRGWAQPLLATGMLMLAAPPFALGAGWFILLLEFGDPRGFGLFLVVLANALMALPYLLRTLDAALVDLDARSGALCASLGIGGWSRFRLIDWAELRRPFGYALGIAAALSLGDLGVIALFGGRDTATLPLLLYQRMGAYRMDEAAAIALLLAILCLCVVSAAERAGGRHDRPLAGDGGGS